MKINFNINLVDFFGRELTASDGRRLSLKDELLKILFSLGSSSSISNEDKFRAYQIGRKMAEDIQDYSAEELSFIKSNVGQYMTAGAYGQLYDLIEGNPLPGIKCND